MGESVGFKCGEWLSPNRGGGLMERTLCRYEGDDVGEVEYRLTVFTADELVNGRVWIFGFIHVDSVMLLSWEGLRLFLCASLLNLASFFGGT